MPTQKQFLDSVGLTELLDELGQYLKTTIPTVNNATLTIQKNGTNVATFTANASTGATANIIVPTVTSDLTNDSGFLGDADVSYDANTKTLIIGGNSMITVTLQGNAVTTLHNIIINAQSDPEYINYDDFPIEVENGTRLNFEGAENLQLQVIMGGVDITNDYIKVYKSVEPGRTGMITKCSIYEITGDTVITVNYGEAGGSN